MTTKTTPPTTLNGVGFIKLTEPKGHDGNALRMGPTPPPVTPPPSVG